MSQRLGTGRYTSIMQINGDVDLPVVNDTDWDPLRGNKNLTRIRETLQRSGISLGSDQDVIKYVEGNSATLFAQNSQGSFGSGPCMFTIISWEYEAENSAWTSFENYDPEPKFFMGMSQQVCPQTEEPFAFVVCLDGSIRIGQKHAMICAGAPAIWAGEVFFCGNGRVFSWGDRSGTYNSRTGGLKAELTKYLLPFPAASFQKFSIGTPKLRKPGSATSSTLSDEIDAL